MKQIRVTTWLPVQILLGILFGVGGCNSAAEVRSVASSEIVGQKVMLETTINGKPIFIRGDHMVARHPLSSFRVEKNASVEMHSVGTIHCDAIQVTDNGSTVECNGNVHAEMNIPASVINENSATWTK